ncbi:CoB--CoM heterodisulfide reductase iron-sulfur subunit B family protein [Desulfurobacterium sp.]|uniref:CoB--CoM heterodisulfide reductase iron-sulfur subunit B family protein n=1 Tax=Desulfurobacterium sp. TaxID=2004706 RepID=UPI00260C88E5|nr:CoB--CoM heterodisulfide reductase iron-sulfur subunit B family protein [Desulfurobacterium sp.]
MRRIGFYRGCCFQGLDFILFEVIKNVLNRFNVELPELRKTVCCGGNVIDEESRFLSVLINGRNMAAAEKENLDLLISCNTCFMVINRVKKVLDENEEIKEKINRILKEEELTYTGNLKLWHILPFLTRKIGFKEIEREVRRKLPVKMAPFYGCHLRYPEKVIKNGELEKLIEVCGGVPTEFEESNTCCGYHAIYTDRATALKKIKKIAESAKEAGAEVIVTPCPLCFKAFDLYQADAKIKEKLPVLFLPEMVALAFGMDEIESGIKYHKIPVEI